MASNARKHTIPMGADKSFNRATIFETFGNSINDVVPVANATERAQVVSDLVAKGAGPTATDPLVVIRGDAPGLHRVEYTYDGSVWLTDVLFFASKSAADTFGAANGGLLTAGDRAIAAGVEYRWSGTAWGKVSTAVATGSVVCPSSGGSGSAPVFWSPLIDVTFPPGLFTAVPNVVVQTVGPAGQVPLGGMYEQATTTGCKVRGMRIGSAPDSLFTVVWTAVQP